jgi:hypothetical protein
MSLGGAGMPQSFSGCLRGRGSELLFSPQTPCCCCPIFLHEVSGTPLSLPSTSLCVRWRDIEFRRHEANSLWPRQEFPTFSGNRWLIIPFAQDRAICLHPEPDQSTLHPSILTFKINFIITLTYEPGYSKCFLSNLKQKMHVNWSQNDGLSLVTLRGWRNAMLQNFDWIKP